MDSVSWSWLHFPMGDDMGKWYPVETGGVTCHFYHSEKVKKEWEFSFIKPATKFLDLPDHACKDGVFALKAMEDLEILARQGSPFFLAVGFERPHLAWTAPKKYWDLYDRDQVVLAGYMELAVIDQNYFYTTSNELRSYTGEDGSDL